MISNAYMKRILASVLIDSQIKYFQSQIQEALTHSSAVYWNIGEHLCMGELAIKAHDLDVHLLLKAMWYSIPLHICLVL